MVKDFDKVPNLMCMSHVYIKCYAELCQPDMLAYLSLTCVGLCDLGLPVTRGNCITAHPVHRYKC